MCAAAPGPCRPPARPRGVHRCGRRWTCGSSATSRRSISPSVRSTPGAAQLCRAFFTVCDASVRLRACVRACRLERSLLRAFLVNCVLSKRMDEVTKFFAANGEALMAANADEWRPWFGQRALPRCHIEPGGEAHHHVAATQRCRTSRTRPRTRTSKCTSASSGRHGPAQLRRPRRLSGSPITERTQESLAVSLRNFMSTVFQEISLPKLLAFNLERTEKMACPPRQLASRPPLRRAHRPPTQRFRACASKSTAFGTRCVSPNPTPPAALGRTFTHRLCTA
jgi:hypothetical protein